MGGGSARGPGANLGRDGQAVEGTKLQAKGYRSVTHSLALSPILPTIATLLTKEKEHGKTRRGQKSV